MVQRSNLNLSSLKRIFEVKKSISFIKLKAEVANRMEKKKGN